MFIATDAGNVRRECSFRSDWADERAKDFETRFGSIKNRAERGSGTSSVF